MVSEQVSSLFVIFFSDIRSLTWLPCVEVYPV